MKSKSIVVITGEEFKEICNTKYPAYCKHIVGRPYPYKCDLRTCPDWKKLQRIPADKIKGEM